MRKVDEGEWAAMMDQAIQERKFSHIEFLWQQYAEIKKVGFFELPF